MVNWDFLIDEQAFTSVLPDEYAKFARPVRDALTIFLEGLPEQRQAEIVARQAALPPTASFSRRLGTLAQCCPVLHKLGQVLARDPRLAEDLRGQLQELESLPPTVPVETIAEILERELGPLDRLHLTLNPPAVAEASVAVVIPFQHSRVSEKQDGVFKILKPGIEIRLEQELELTERVGAHLDQRCEELGIPHLDYQESFEQVRDKLQFEVRLDLEQQHLAQAREFYADQTCVRIPALFPHCTSQVTAMQRVTGGKVTDHVPDSERERRRLAELVVRALIARPIFAKDGRALFHCDPHAGNLFLTEDQRLGILDWSLVGTLGEAERVAIVQIMLGAVTLHTERIVRVLTDLAERPPHAGALRQVVETALRKIRQGEFPGIRWLIGMLDDAVQTARLRVGADLMLFRKTLHTLDGVLLDLQAGGSPVDGVLLEEFLRHLAGEWPRRWTALPNSRQFATRLSNVDLTRWMLDFPATATRYWVDQLRDLLQTQQPTKITGSEIKGANA